MMNAGQFPCPKCAGVFQVDATSVSGQVRCPHCQEVVQVPTASSTNPPPPVSRQSKQPSPPAESPGASDATDMLPQAIDGTTGQQAGPLQARAEAKQSTIGISLEESVRTAGRGKETVELTQRPAEERATRRRRRNFWFWSFCLAIIFATLAVLLRLA